MNIDLIVSHCKSLNFYELQNYAGANFNIVYEHVKSTTKVNPNDVLVPTIFTCIAVDGKLGEREWDFIANFIGGYSYDKALSTAGDLYCSEAQEIVKKLYDHFPAAVKEAYAKMCIAVLCVDHDVNYVERSFIRTLIS